MLSPQERLKAIIEAMPDQPPDNSPLRDGFTYNLSPFARATPFRYYAAALQNLEVLRRANLYRPRWYVFPDDINQPLPAYETLEYQISVTAGSYLWGYNFTELDSDQDATTPSNILIQVTEACTGIELFQDFVGGLALSQYQASADQRGKPNPQILSTPRLVLEPGLVNLELSNRAATTTYCQLLLLFAEPMIMLGEV